MKHLLVIICVILSSIGGQSKAARTTEYYSGYKRLYVDTKEFGAFPVALWYPTTRQSKLTRLGPFTMDISLAAPVGGRSSTRWSVSKAKSMFSFWSVRS